MKVGIANDHAAVDLKNDVKAYLEAKGYEVVNFGTDEKVSTSYAIYGYALAKAVKKGEVDLGIAICGTGVGISLACNKVKGIRAGVCSEPATARLIRQHNNAQIVAFGARIIGPEMAHMIVDEFLTAEYEGGRHQKRLDMLTEIEETQELSQH